MTYRTPMSEPKATPSELPVAAELIIGKRIDALELASMLEQERRVRGHRNRSANLSRARANVNTAISSLVSERDALTARLEEAKRVEWELANGGYLVPASDAANLPVAIDSALSDIDAVATTCMDATMAGTAKTLRTIYTRLRGLLLNQASERDALKAERDSALAEPGRLYAALEKKWKEDHSEGMFSKEWTHRQAHLEREAEVVALKAENAELRKVRDAAMEVIATDAGLGGRMVDALDALGAALVQAQNIPDAAPSTDSGE